MMIEYNESLDGHNKFASFCWVREFRYVKESKSPMALALALTDFAQQWAQVDGRKQRDRPVSAVLVPVFGGRHTLTLVDSVDHAGQGVEVGVHGAMQMVP